MKTDQKLNETTETEKKRERSPKKPDRIMFVCAHPDDEAIGSGGTIAKFAQEGKDVIVLICTTGENSHPWKKKQIVIAQRKKEAEVSSEILGVKTLLHWDYPDGNLTKLFKDGKAVIELQKLLEEYKPSKVFTHARDDALYPDHVAVHKVTVEAVDLYAKNRKVDVYTFNIWSLSVLNRNKPKLHVDISDTFEKKKAAIACFKSQGVALLQLWPTIFYKAIVNGLIRNTQFGENFYKIR